MNAQDEISMYAGFILDCWQLTVNASSLQVGAHSSIVEASFRALVDGLEFGIANCTEVSSTLPLQ